MAHQLQVKVHLASQPARSKQTTKYRVPQHQLVMVKFYKLYNFAGLEHLLPVQDKPKSPPTASKTSCQTSQSITPE